MITARKLSDYCSGCSGFNLKDKQLNKVEKISLWRT